MLVAFLGALLASLLVGGGGFIQHGDMVLGLSSIGFAAIGLGILYAAIQTSAAATRAINAGIHTPGLTVRQLMTYVLENNVNLDTHVYVGYKGLDVASGVFNCLLDGRRALVIEREEA